VLRIDEREGNVWGVGRAGLGGRRKRRMIKIGWGMVDGVVV